MTRYFIEPLVNAVNEVLDSVDDTGCCGDVVVVSRSSISQLAKVMGIKLDWDVEPEDQK
jgi:hypothetical protein